MRRWTLIALALTACLLVATPATADQISDLVTIYLFDGAAEQFYTDTTGSASFGGMNAIWSVADFGAHVTFTGSFNSPGNSVVFYVEWLGTSGTMPLSASVESSTAGLYSIYPIFQRPEDSEPVATMVQTGLSGPQYFGHYYPECDKISFAVYLDESNTDYDLTVTMDWGAGVPNEDETWGGIKSLYR
jgi:hypothetical protein